MGQDPGEQEVRTGFWSEAWRQFSPGSAQDRTSFLCPAFQVSSGGWGGAILSLSVPLPPRAPAQPSDPGTHKPRAFHLLGCFLPTRVLSEK